MKLFACLVFAVSVPAVIVGCVGDAPAGGGDGDSGSPGDGGTGDDTGLIDSSAIDGEASAPNPAWTFALTGRTDVESILVEPITGNIFVTGWARGDVPELGLTATNGDNEDALVIKLDGATGAVLWAKTFGGSGDDIAGAMTLSGGALYLVGNTTSPSVAFAGATTGALLTYPSTTAALTMQSFVARLDPSSGAPSWAMSPDANETAGAAHFSLCSGIAFGTAGLFIGCNYEGAKFGPATPAPTSPASVLGEFAVLELNSLGAYVNGGVIKTFTRSSGICRLNALADSGGFVYLAGNHTDTLEDVTLGNTSIAVGSGSENGWVLRFPEAGGADTVVLWKGDNTSATYAIPMQMVLSASGVLVSGSFSGAPAFGTTLPTAPTQDMFLAGLPLALTETTFVQGFGGTGEDDGFAVALDGTASPSIWYGGRYYSTDFTLASTLLPAETAGSSQGMFARMSTAGVPVEATPLLSQTGNMTVNALGTDDANGYVLVAGTYNGQALFDDGTHASSTSDSAGFVIRRKM